MAKDGQNLQRLIRAIEGALAAGDKKVKIEMPKYLPDKITGEMREHDVVLIVTTGHHETFVALECRDRSRPVGVGAVEEFANKCEATGIHSGIIVSSKGFYRTAITKATFYNIGCFTLQEAERFDWCLAAGMAVHKRTLTKIHITVLFPDDARPPRETLEDELGNSITGETLRNWAQQVVKHYGNPKEPFRPEDIEGPGEYTRTAHDSDPKLWGIVDGQKIKASVLLLTVTYRVTEDIVPIKFRTYHDAGRSKELTQAAVATMDLGDGKCADMVLSTNAEGHITVSVIGGGQRSRPKRKAVPDEKT
jgi:hypothetical protein